MDGGSHASGIGLFTIDQPFLGICALHSRFGLALAQSPGRKERDEGNIYGEERSRAYRSDFDPPDKSQILRRKRCEPTILLWMLGHASNLNTQLPTPCVLCNRLRESSNINQSLLTLGTVINALSGMADAGDGDDDSRPPSPGGAMEKKTVLVPYRNRSVSVASRCSPQHRSATLLTSRLLPLAAAS